jgi:hypothetical protein
MIARWMLIGFVLWLAVTLVFRFVGGGAFSLGLGGVSWLLLIAPPAMFVATYALLKALRVATTDRAEAASIFAFPGFLIGIYEINSFQAVFPNLDPSLSMTFAALMYASYAAAILAGIVSSRLRLFGRPA